MLRRGAAGARPRFIGTRNRVKTVGQDYGEPDPLIVVDNTYDSATGRLTRTTRKNFVGDRPRNEVIDYTYTKMGQVDSQTGNGTFPVDYVYNSYGQLTDIYQYRDAAGANKTRVEQVYDTATGLLEEKRHYSTATAYKATKYEYNALDQVKKRSWARSGGTVAASYNYSTGSSSAYGLLLSTTYTGGSVSTPSVTRSYDLMGRLKTVSDWTGTREFKPDAAYGNLVILEEDLDTSDTGHYGTYTVRYTREDGSGSTVRGRPNGVELGTGLGAGFSVRQYQRNLFDTASGRIATVGTYTSKYNWYRPFTYTYHNDSDLVADVSYSSYYKKINNYESWRNNRSQVKTTWQGATRADFVVPNSNDFTWQSQIERWRLVGTAAATNELSDVYGWPDTADVKHGYDTRGQVTSRDYLFSGPADESYSFDTAGNPTDLNGSGYEVNALNQIEPADPESEQEFFYDDDGNQIVDNDWTYTYDAENRLVQMVSKPGNPVHPKRLEFNYDYLNRRVAKRVYNATAGGNLTLERRFIYDGFNCIAEIDGSHAMKRSYHWGLDRASSLTATGGLEALLLITDWDAPDAWWPVYDLSSNVVALIGRFSAIDAAYAYDALGQATKKGSGAQNDANPWRLDYPPAAESDVSPAFAGSVATKYTDDETGLVYFGHRYYNPKTGRLGSCGHVGFGEASVINRDPIGEHGGLNLYRYTSNDTINRWDYLGLCGGEGEPPCELPAFTVTADRPEPAGGMSLQDAYADMQYDLVTLMDLWGDTQDFIDNLDLTSGETNEQNADNTQQKEKVPLDWLKKLCGTNAGRKLVADLNAGKWNVFDVNWKISGLSEYTVANNTYLTSGFGDGLSGGNNIFLFSVNASAITSAIANNPRFNYSGSDTDLQVSTLIHETLHFANPTASEAQVWYLTDQNLGRYNLPVLFGLPDAKAYGGLVNPAHGYNGVQASTQSGSSNITISKNDLYDLKNQAAQYVAWDCSRVK